MKTIKLILSAALFAASITTFAQVGVGETAPSAALDVKSTGTDETTNALEVNNASARLVTVLDNGTVGIGNASPDPATYLQLGVRTKFRRDGVITFGSHAAHGVLTWDTGQAIFKGLTGNNAIFGSGDLGQRAIQVQSTTGNVLLGSNVNLDNSTTTVATKLQVNGYITLGSSDAQGNATPVAGMMRYNSGSDKFEGYVNDAGAGSPGWVELH